MVSASQKRKSLFDFPGSAGATGFGRMGTYTAASTCARTSAVTGGYNQELNSFLCDMRATQAADAARYGDKLFTPNSAARQRGVELAWRYEKKSILMGGKGSENWTAAERREIVETGSLRGSQGHHQRNVALHPEDQANPHNIKFYKCLLGYRKGADGEPEIVPEEASIVERIFNMYLSGETINRISTKLREENLQIPGKRFSFSASMIKGILRNERYCGDSILQKTVTIDCIGKVRRKNTGEAPMYYVQNSHVGIISRELFHKTQEELARRMSREPNSTKTATTATGKYSRYALSNVMICAECGSRYKRVTWTSRGKKRVVWRCISRLDYGKRYCKTSLTVDETALHAAIVRAINRFNEEDESTYMALMRATIGEAIGLTGGTDEIDLLRRKIDGLNRKMVSLINESVESGEGIESHEAEFKELSDTIELLQGRIQKLEEALASDQVNDSRILQLQQIIADRASKKMEYDDTIVHQMIECVKVYPDGRLDIIFGGGYLIEERLEKEN